MSCGDALVRRMGKRAFMKMVTDARYYRVITMIAERLGEGFEVRDAWMLNVVTAEAEVVRRRDGKKYYAHLNLATGELTLKHTRHEVRQA